MAQTKGHRWVATRQGGPETFEYVEFEPAAPQAGEVQIEVRAAGMNPFDLKQPAMLPPTAFPHPVGQELAGVVTAVGDGGAEADDGPLAVGDQVLAYGPVGSWSTSVTIPASTVLHRPDGLGEPEAAGLLLSGTTAADLLHTVGLTEGETIFVSGASGGVGQLLVQMAVDLGARVIGTSSPRSAERVTQWGAEQIDYGEGLMDRARALLPEGVDAAVDLAGDPEGVDTAFALLKDKDNPRFGTIVRTERIERDSDLFVGSNTKEHRAYRREIRQQLVDMAAEGRLRVPIAATFPLRDGAKAVELLATSHSGGKVILVP